MLPELKASISPAINVDVVMDRTTTIRASVHDIEFTLIISIVLVVLVVFIFLRNLVGDIHSQRGRAAVAYWDVWSDVPARLQPGQLVADGARDLDRFRSGRRHRRYREHYALSRRRDDAVQAALVGSKEIGFTVLSMSTSLVAVFIPILLMGGIVGRLFREFAVTLSVAIAVSLLVSLTTTPMMCAQVSATA